MAEVKTNSFINKENHLKKIIKSKSSFLAQKIEALYELDSMYGEVDKSKYDEEAVDKWISENQ